MKNLKWEKNKKIGVVKFTVLYGALYSITTIFLFILIRHFSATEASRQDDFWIIIILVATGPIWSFFYWRSMNKKYQDEK